MNGLPVHEPAPLRVIPYGSEDALSLWRQKNPRWRQLRYLHRYLTGLKASAVVEEPYYFDRDYLAEFSAFYSVSAAGYPNTCQLLHFFSGNPPVTGEGLRDAIGSTRGSTARASLQDRYLGFCVIRPLPNAPLGRTVLKWWTPETKVVAPSRNYTTHLAGIPLTVRGLAWQQQDKGTAACATVSIWSMLHSAAFDERHAVPTTISITAAANRAAYLSTGTSLLPSEGLSYIQMREAIKEHGFAPMTVMPDCFVKRGEMRLRALSPSRFRTLCGAYIGSGYTVLVLCEALSAPAARHSVCAVAFEAGKALVHGGIALEDTGIVHLYTHDDGVGPAARFAVLSEVGKSVADGKDVRYTVLRRKPPSRMQESDPEEPYPDLVPIGLLVAVHPEIRTCADQMWKLATATALVYAATLRRGAGAGVPTVVGGVRFSRLSNYQHGRLEGLLSQQLGRVRLELVERVAPMSLFLGVVRLGVIHKGSIRPQVEILYDTTDNSRTNRPFAHLVLDASAEPYVRELNNAVGLGVRIDAFSP